MSVIDFEQNPPEPGLKQKSMDGGTPASSAEVKSVLDMTIKARNGAHKLGLSFEAYLLQSAVLALSENLDPKSRRD